MKKTLLLFILGFTSLGFSLDRFHPEVETTNHLLMELNENVEFLCKEMIMLNQKEAQILDILFRLNEVVQLNSEQVWDNESTHPQLAD